MGLSWKYPRNLYGFDGLSPPLTVLRFPGTEDIFVLMPQPQHTDALDRKVQNRHTGLRGTIRF